MACYHPLRGFRAQRRNPSGKYSIVFNENEGFRDLPVILPCGRCIGCRLEYSRQWAIRLTHEASLHPSNCFLTLTYAPDKLPPNGSLRYRDMQLFWKKLRKRLGKSHRIKYFQCGEYGEKNLRPHYHACLFNYDFRRDIQIGDRKFLFSPIKQCDGYIIYRSELLEDLWEHGHSSVGELNFETAAYVARYVTKKISGDMALHHYNQINYTTGEIISEVLPEKSSGSNGLGLGWYEKYKSDVFPRDHVQFDGRQFKTPKYYSNKFELEFPDKFRKIKARRSRLGKLAVADNSRDRLDVKEEVQYLNSLKSIRSYENES